MSEKNEKREHKLMYMLSSEDGTSDDFNSIEDVVMEWQQGHAECCRILQVERDADEQIIRACEYYPNGWKGESFGEWEAQ